jgi:hypothetical protein
MSYISLLIELTVVYPEGRTLTGPFLHRFDLFALNREVALF